jgi:WD40 repeat protein/tetratricopeptide (TPR) repeat protein
MTTATVTERPFASLTELQEQHAALVKEVGTNFLAPNKLPQIDRFVHRSLATGAVLDAADERDAAQSLITFWVTRLRSAVRFEKAKAASPVPEFDDTLLAEFEPAALDASVIAPADAWLRAQSEPDQALARRLVLRLINLREDGAFALVSGARGLCEELTPQDGAEQVLRELVRLGVVRKVRETAGQPEYALRSDALLQRWPRLRGWMDQRRDFRQRATEWAKKREVKAAQPPSQSFGRRVERALGRSILSFGIWLESRWWAIVRMFRADGAGAAGGAGVLKSNEYEEAESYRDKNEVEHKLVYLKRQLDKEREERRHIRTALITVAALVFAVLSVFASVGWIGASLGWTAADEAREAETRAKNKAEEAAEEETKAKNKAEKAAKDAREAQQQEESERKRANLRAASFQIARGAELGPDAPGALLWYATAWATVTKNSDPPAGGKPDWLKTSHLLRLGAAKRQLPALTAMAFQSDGPEGLPRSVATVSPSGTVALTAGFDGTRTLVVTVWKSDGASAWNSEALSIPTDASAPGRALAAYLSPNGQAAVVTVERTVEREAKTTVYPLTIPPAGAPTRHPESTIDGVVADGKFAPDGQHFGVVSSKVEKGGRKTSTVSVWKVAGWQSRPLANPAPEGTIASLAFAPPGTPARVAGALGSDAPNPKTLCLEWALDDEAKQPDVDQPKRYGAALEQAQRSAADEVAVVAYGPAGQDLLFVARGSQKENFGPAWLFDTRNGTQDQPGQALDRWRHFGPVRSAAFNPGGDRLVTGSHEGGVVLWRVPPQGFPLGWNPSAVTIGKHDEQVFQVGFSPDGQQIVTASRDQRARIWHAASGRPLLPLYHSGSVTEGAFTSDGSQVVTVSQGAAYRWALPRTDSRALLTDGFRSEQSGATTEALDPNGTVVVLGGWSRRRATDVPKGWARAWDTKTGLPLTPELPHDKPVRHVAVSPQLPLLICTTDDDGLVQIWDKQGRSKVVKPACDEQAVFTAFGQNGRPFRLLVLAREHSDAMTGATQLSVHPVDPTGKADEAAHVGRYDYPLTAGLFSPGGERVVAYAGDGGDGRGRVVVWEPGGTQPRALEQSGNRPAHTDPITHATFNSDGTRLVVSSRDDTATVWARSATDWERYELRGLRGKGEELIDRHTADVNFASFDATGNRVVTASADGSAIVWERVAEEQRYRPQVRFRPEQVAGGVSQAIFISDRLVLAVSNDRTARLWDTSGGRALVSAWSNLPIGAALRFQPEKPDRPERSGTGQVLVVGREETVTGFGAPAYGALSYGAPTHGAPAYAAPAYGAAPTSAAPLFVVTEWSLAALPEQPGEDLLAIAQLTAARRIFAPDETQTAPLPLDEADKLWRRVRPHATTAPAPVSHAELTAWHIRQAMQCEASANWHGARWHWDKVLDLGPILEGRHVIFGHAARARVELRDWPRAEEAFREALQGRERDPLLLCARADARVRRARAERTERGFVHLPIGLALAQVTIGQAVEDYTRVLEADPDNRAALVGLADAHMVTENYVAAVEQLDKVLSANKRDPELFLLRARALGVSSHSDRATADYLTAVQLFKEQQRWNEASAQLHEALGLFKGTEKPSRLQARIHAELGLVQMNRADRGYTAPQQRETIYGEAKKHFRKALDIDETDWEFWSGLARCHERLREWKEAREAYEKGIARSPGNTTLIAARAVTLLQLQDWDEAAAAYQTLIERDPKVLQYRFRLAEVHLGRIPSENKARPERLEAARRCLEDATRVPEFSKDPLLWSRLARVQLAAGKVEEYRATRVRLFEILETLKSPEPAAMNTVAWAAALATDTPEGAARAVKLAEQMVRLAPREANYLNTYGAVLYRAGKGEAALGQLQTATRERAISFYSPEQKVYGDALDLLFGAMIQNALGQREAARQSLQTALQTSSNFEATQQSASLEQGLTGAWRRLELDIISEEDKNLIKP